MLQSVLHVLSSVVFGIASIFGVTSGIEQPHYDVVARIGSGVEIRQYPARLAAETTVAAGDDNPRSAAFRLLAGYIFGANRARSRIEMTAPVEIGGANTSQTADAEKADAQPATAHIAMTAPVEVVPSGSALVMRFFMPAEYTKDTLPVPTDPRVKIVQIPGETRAVLRYSGSTGDAAVAAHADELMNALRPTRWKAHGVATALFYNPPWTLPFLRTNEVGVAVSPAE